LLSDSKKEVAVQYGANSPLWTKRITFVVNEKGKIEKIYRKMNVNTHAEKILSEIIKKS
jgi:peroxiredoxin|tara:strand:+ start:1426 stop:1602 length:177 start_codon:yes stop_codon:yes gene_type:complete